jgi:hypothetical protein
MDPTPSQPLAYSLQKIFLLLITLLASLFLYTFLHEAGHALVSVLVGGHIQVFSVNFWDLSAHVSAAGDFSRGQQIVSNLAGVGLPILVWLGFILAAPRRANLLLELVKLCASLMALNPLLVYRPGP